MARILSYECSEVSFPSAAFSTVSSQISKHATVGCDGCFGWGLRSTLYSGDKERGGNLKKAWDGRELATHDIPSSW